MSRARIAAAKAAVGTITRLEYGDAEAIDLATELDLDQCRHPEALKVAVERIAALPPRPDNGDDDALIAWATSAKKAREAFWDAFEGEVVDGVEIIRRRA